MKRKPRKDNEVSIEKLLIKKGISLPELLSETGIRSALERFYEEGMPDAEIVVIVWRDRGSSIASVVSGGTEDCHLIAGLLQDGVSTALLPKGDDFDIFDFDEEDEEDED